MPVQTATTPTRIKVLPKPNSLIGIPKAIARKPANTEPIPAISKTIIINLTP